MNQNKLPAWASDKVKEGMNAFVAMIEAYPSFEFKVEFEKVTFPEEIGFNALVSWCEFGSKTKRTVTFNVMWNYNQIFTSLGDPIDCWQFVFEDSGFSMSSELFFIELFQSAKKMLEEQKYEQISAFGDGYYDGFNDAKKINDGDKDDCGYLSDHSEDDVRRLSEKAESEYLSRLTETHKRNDMTEENNGSFFVMLNTQMGGYTPLMLCSEIASEHHELAKFKTEVEARESASSSVLGEQFGFEVFQIGYGF